MFVIRVDRSHAIVEFELVGLIDVDEMQRFVEELRAATTALMGEEIKIKADVRGMRPASPEVAEMIRAVQAFGLRSGVTRVAEIVENDRVALQLNAVAKDSGTSRILRRFWDDDSAREWLLHGDPRPSRRPPST